MKSSRIYLKGNIFSSPAEVIVNPVNTFGVMGKGLAAEFKRRYPIMFERYKNFCHQKKFSVGQLFISHEKDYSVLLFPTKKHWRGRSKLEYIEAGLKKFVDTYEQKGINSVAFPKLGCGYGGLQWEAVRPLMEKYLNDLPIDIYIYLDNEKDLTATAAVALRTDFTIDGVITGLAEYLKVNPMLELEGKNYDVTLENKSLHFDSDEEKFSADEVFLKNSLDNISEQNIFQTDRREIEFKLTAALLQKIGYLSPVLIQTGDDEFYAGYQLNRGALRILEKNPLPKKAKQISLFDD